MTTHPRTKPTQITRTFPGSEPPDDDRRVLMEFSNEHVSRGFYDHGWFDSHYEKLEREPRRWAELPTFPSIKKGKSK